ncbi:MAG: hypothetical protein RL654_1241 [Pseudomonadota bacterium]|jgi:uncharacterized protein (UPF0276 family)
MHPTAPRPAAGIGLRAPHLAEVRERRPIPGFLEVHSENFFAEGGAARAALRGLRADHAISLHGVGLSLGSATGLDDDHLGRLAALVAEVDPVRVSDHASFARVDPGRGRPVWHGADLLPVAFTRGALAVMAANVQRVQDRLGRPLLVENLSACLAWADDVLAEPDFLAALARRSGCGLLLDVNNLVVNALNAQPAATPAAQADAEATRRACAWIDRLVATAPVGAVGEIHLAGYTVADDGLVIDDHGSRVHAPVWPVYAHALARLGAVPTLVEWDTDVPALDVLLDEAARADVVMREVCA